MACTVQCRRDGNEGKALLHLSIYSTMLCIDKLDTVLRPTVLRWFRQCHIMSTVLQASMPTPTCPRALAAFRPKDTKQQANLNACLNAVAGR